MKIIASHLFSSQREIKCITPLEHAPCTLFGLGSTLALLPHTFLLRSPASQGQASWHSADGEFSAGRQWKGHTGLPLSVPKLLLPPSLQTLPSLKHKHTHIHIVSVVTHTHTANSDIKPRPDVGILSLNRRIIRLSTIWPQAVFCINESQNIVMHYNSITPLHLLNDKREKHAQCIK